MTFYICDRKIPCCIGCYDGYCKHTSDINHRKSKQYPITFIVVESIIPGRANLFEVPYIGTDDLHLEGFWHEEN